MTEQSVNWTMAVEEKSRATEDVEILRRRVEELEASQTALQAECDELRQDKIRLTTILENGSDGVCLLSPDGSVSYESPALTLLLV